MDDETFSAIAEQYTDYACNIAYRMLNNLADTQDVVQDAFLSAYRAKDRFRGDSAITTWLYRIVVNVALMKLRKEHRPRQTQPADVAEMGVVDWSPGPEQLTLNEELRERLEEAIGQLPEDLRVTVVLRDVEQLSNEEAAGILGVTVAAFKARLHRARLALRSRLSAYVQASRG